MESESPKEGSQRRDVQLGFSAFSELDEPRLPRRSDAADHARHEKPRAIVRRSNPGQPLLPFDRSKPKAPSPTVEPPQATLADHAASNPPSVWSEPARLPALPEEVTAAAGEVAKARDLLHAVRVLKLLESEERPPGPEERAALARFPGFGALALRIFPDPVTGQYKGPTWQALGEELAALLSPAEYASARRTVFNAFYTSPTVVVSMFEAMRRLGVPKDATVLEPGCGAGNFLRLAPERMNFIGVEQMQVRGSEFQGQWQAVEGTTDVGNDGSVGLGHPKTGSHSVRSLKKQRNGGEGRQIMGRDRDHRRWHRERFDGQEMFTPDVQRCPAGR